MSSINRSTARQPRSEVQLGLATLAVDTAARFEKVDERFTTIDERFTTIDERFTTIDERFTTIDKRFDAVDLQFKRVDARFAGVESSIESARVQLVDHVGRVHSELTAGSSTSKCPGREAATPGEGQAECRWRRDGTAGPRASAPGTANHLFRERSNSLNLNGLGSQRQPLSARNRSASVAITSPVTKRMRDVISG